MIRTQIYIPDDLHQELKLLANVERKNFSTLIREGAKLIVEKKRKEKQKTKLDPWKHFIGKGKANKKTNAVQDIRDYYANDVI